MANDLANFYCLHSIGDGIAGNNETTQDNAKDEDRNAGMHRRLFLDAHVVATHGDSDGEYAMLCI